MEFLILIREKVIPLFRAIQGACIDPLIDVITAEINGVEKVFDIVQHFSNANVRKIQETELGQTCDIISWGLDDQISVDDLVASGNEYMNDILNKKDQLDHLLNEIIDLFPSN